MRAVLYLILLLAPLSVHAEWRASASDGFLEFVPSYDGTELAGRFQQFEVSLNPGVTSPAGGHLEVQVHVASADMQDADLNAGIASPDFFHATKYPLAVFVSTSIVAIGGADGYRARGRLELKGLAHEVDIPFTWAETGDQAEMRGTLELSRSDFGIGQGDWAADNTIADPVGVRFRLTLHASP